MDKIIDILSSTDLFGWRIIEVKAKTTELFYVAQKLETNRATNQLSYTVTIYVQDNKKIGSSTFDIYAYMNEQEIRDKIESNKINAKFALNEYYELPKYEHLEPTKGYSNLEGDALAHLEEIKDAVFKGETIGYLSATEFFLYEIEERLVNSNGISVSQKKYRCNIELIPSFEDVEVYQMLRLESYEKEEITKKVDELLHLAKDRYNAKDLDVKENLNIILENDEVHQLLEFFSDDLTYGAKYQNINLFELNESVQKDAIGDKLSMKMVPYYKGCIASREFDSDGVILKEVELINNGIAKNRYGSYRFGYYLKEEKPTGILPVMVVEEGSKAYDDFKKNKYIRCARFSNMQLDQSTGFFGGEVRLGFYFDGEKEIPVTGFSISGNINELKKEIYLSKEMVSLPNYHGPKYIEIKGMKIA